MKCEHTFHTNVSGVTIQLQMFAGVFIRVKYLPCHSSSKVQFFINNVVYQDEFE